MKRICIFLSLTSGVVGAFMLLPIMFSEIYSDGCTLALFKSAAAAAVASCLLAAAGRGGSLQAMTRREAILAVVLAWCMAGTLASLPYHLTGTMPTYVDALFEGVSGVTTTGATVLRGFDEAPRSLIFWRSLSQWIGGIGIVALTLVFFPASSAGMQMFSAEISGPVNERFTPRVQRTARFLLKTYVALTAIQALLLLTFGGLSFFDALNLSLSTAATGGFLPYKDSIGHFDSGVVELITAVFLFFAATNVTLYHAVIASRSIGPIKRNTEFKFFVGIVVFVGILTSATLKYEGFCSDIWSSFRDGFFHTVSMISTCGYFTQDYAHWPPSLRYLSLVLMLMGGCAVSTAGGITCVRAITALKHTKQEFARLLHPRAILPVRFSGRAVPYSMVSACYAFIIAYLLILLAGFVVLTMLGQDMVTAISSAAATLSNLGPGMGMTGPTRSYAEQSSSVKAVCMVLMVAGRLEIFTLVVLATKDFWRKND